MRMLTRSFAALSGALVLIAGLTVCATSTAADLVRVAVFPVSSSLPFYVARDRGYFEEHGIRTEEIRLMGGPAVMNALITGDADVASNLVTLEGMNGNTLKPGVATYFAINGQNDEYRMEQFVAQESLEVSSLEDLVDLEKRPLRVMSAPGPANMAIARAGLASIGLQEGQDFILNELAMNLHTDAMLAGTFDLGFTLEPNATVMQGAGDLVMLEAGIISTYVIGDSDAQAYAAGAAASIDFIEANPDVARRFALAWAMAVDDIANDPSARDHLEDNTLTPPDVIMSVPLPKFTMVSALTEQDLAEFSAFINWGSDTGLLQSQVNAADFIKALEQ